MDMLLKLIHFYDILPIRNLIRDVIPVFCLF